MFTAELFTIAKTLKQPKCPSTEEWIKKMHYTHTHTHTHNENGILLSHKKLFCEIMPFAPTQMDLEILILRVVSQTKKEKYQMTFLILGI